MFPFSTGHSENLCTVHPVSLPSGPPSLGSAWVAGLRLAAVWEQEQRHIKSAASQRNSMGFKRMAYNSVKASSWSDNPLAGPVWRFQKIVFLRASKMMFFD